MVKAALSVYRAKRNFSKTAEPRGSQPVVRSARLRFVIQKHAARRLHYDLRLELNGVFKSWAVTKGPSLDPADKRLAVEVEDHPLDYGDFEGTIPHGEYGGGTVQLWDRGFWQAEGAKTAQDAYAAGDLKFTLDGSRLQGGWVLVRMRRDRNGGKRSNWLLIKHRDASAKPGDHDALLEDDKSVASGRTLAQISQGIGTPPIPFMLAASKRTRADAIWTQSQPAARNKPAIIKRRGVTLDAIPDFVAPQLSNLVDRPPEQPGWGHEIKLDGYRAQVRVVNHQVVIKTRTGLNWTERFASIARDAAALRDCLLDGEVVVLDKQQLPSFSALQAALSEQQPERLVYFAFDLLFENHEDLRGLPLAERKSRLQALLKKHAAGDRLRYVSHLESSGHDVFASAEKMGLEGIISKRLDAPYRSGRTGSWLKAKCRPGLEVVIGGWSTASGALRSLLVGVHRDGVLQYVGRVGTGYGRNVAKALLPELKRLTRDENPFAGPNVPAKERDVRWLDPLLVAEIEFAGWTGSQMIREASFKGLRQDKPAQDVAFELPSPTPEKAVKKAAPASTPASARRSTRTSTRSAKGRLEPDPAPAFPNAGGAVVMGVTISRPDKALWPDAGDATPVTKIDLARYYEQVGAWMLPHLAGRPCSIVRLPDGIGGEQFFQRHAGSGMSKLLSAVKVRGDKAPYMQIDRVEALAAVAQIAGLELHPWNCARGDPEVAGRLVFDLDPAPDVNFSAVIVAAQEIRERLRAVGLESFCKTTGGKGLHVVTPLTEGKKAVRWPVAKNFAHLVCAQMAQDSPDKYLDTMAKKLRGGKIFLDYLRNDRTATAVAVLSPRARPGAAVSMPVHWKDLNGNLDPKAFTLRTAPRRLHDQKPWEAYEKAARSLADAIRRLTRSEA